MIKINRFQHILEFEKYIKDRVDNDSYYSLLKLLKDNFDNVFIYSGVIRNYFINYQGNFHDIDIVIQDNNKDKEDENYIKKIIRENYNYTIIEKEQTYGLKYEICNNNKSMTIEIWPMKDSKGFEYGYIHDVTKLSYNIVDLVNTAFFNCSSIAYDVKKRWFIYNDFFIDFLNTKILKINFDMYGAYGQYCFTNISKIIEYYFKYNIIPSEKVINNFFLYNINEFKENMKSKDNDRINKLKIIDDFCAKFNILEKVKEFEENLPF